MITSDPACEAAVELLGWLKRNGYAFVTPTRDTYHINRLRRAFSGSHDLVDMFGWTRRFASRALAPDLFALMKNGCLISPAAFGRLRSNFGCASLGDALLFHTSLSSSSANAVFFGPDSYRFAAFLRRRVHHLPCGARVVDVGSGTGAGVLAMAALRADLQLVVADINATALRLARINLDAAGVGAEFVLSDGLAEVTGRIDAVIANPPYLSGRKGRTYRQGGRSLGADLTVDWVRQAASRIEPGGTILLYSGSAIVHGADPVRGAIVPPLMEAGYDVEYEEVDPDIFGRTLLLPAYRNVDRIAAVTMVATKPHQGALGSRSFSDG